MGLWVLVFALGVFCLSDLGVTCILRVLGGLI